MFGDEAFQKTITVKQGYADGTLFQYDWCPYKKLDARDVHVQRKGYLQIQRETVICKPRK